jgi:hypothetical protein
MTREPTHTATRLLRIELDLVIDAIESRLDDKQLIRESQQNRDGSYNEKK